MSDRAAAIAGVVVEFAGLPGAGKTTVADSTHRILLAEGVTSRVSDAGISASAPPAVRAGRRLALAATELARAPVRGADAVRAIRRLDPGSARDALAGAVQWFAVQRLEARARRTPGVHLLEEGPMQTLWTLALRSRGHREEVVGLLARSERLPGGLPVGGHLLVVVEAPLPVVSARLANRASTHSRTQRLAERDRDAELETGRRLLDDLLAGSGHARLVVVNDGQEGVVELGRRVATWVLRAAT